MFGPLKFYRLSQGDFIGFLRSYTHSDGVLLFAKRKANVMVVQTIIFLLKYLPTWHCFRKSGMYKYSYLDGKELMNEVLQSGLF